MNSSMKYGFLIVFSVFVFMLLFVGMAEDSGSNSLIPSRLLQKGSVIESSRKLLGFNTLDYDDAGPNPKHDPRGRKGGGGRP